MTEQESEDVRRKAVLFNDLSDAIYDLELDVHIQFKDKALIRNYLWDQGWRRDVRPEDENHA